VNDLKVSIITVCLNSAKSIENTIKSVLSQSYPAIEYIIIDGQSTDGTLNIIDRYGNRISKVISERDNGHIDAMNKGIRLATGDIIYILNSDDMLYDKNVVRDIAAEFEKDHSLDLVHGKVLLAGLPKSGIVSDGNRNVICKRDLLKYDICHQSVFCKKNLFKKTGLLDIRYKTSADFNWLLCVFEHPEVKLKFIDRLIAIYNYKGMAYQNKYACFWERIIIVNKHFSTLIFAGFLISFLTKLSIALIKKVLN